MKAWLRSWKGGLAVAAALFVVAVTRVATADGGAWLTWIWFPLAAGYAFAAVTVRRLVVSDQTVGRGQLRELVGGNFVASTRDRVGAVLAGAAAVAGLMLVFSTHDALGDAHEDGKLGTHSSTLPASGEDRPAGR